MELNAARGRGLSRRSFLAASAAALACATASCSRSRRTIGGRIVNDSERRGHRLRDGSASAQVVSREDASVVIVGGGVAGLSAAWKLARAGFEDFLLLELEDATGGTSAGGENHVTSYPWGAHYIPVPSRAQKTLCELLGEMGVVRGFDAHGQAIPVEEHLLRAPDERLFFAGEWCEGLYPRDGASRDDLRQLERFELAVDELAQRRDDAGRRWFTLPTASGSSCAEVLALEHISFAEWLAANGFDSPRLLWYLEYATRDDFGTLLEDTPAFAGLHYFAARERSRERSESTHYLTWPDGNAHVARHLARSAAGRVRTGLVVFDLVEAQDGVIARAYDVAADAVREFRADRILCLVPPHSARRIVPRLRAEPDTTRTSAWVVANLTLRRRPAERGVPIAWDNVLHDSESLGYVVATHQLDRAERDDVWTWYRPFCERDAAAARQRVLATPWEGWRDEVMRDLVRAHPDIEDVVETIDVWRHGHAMPRTPARPEKNAAVAASRIHLPPCERPLFALFEDAQWSGVAAAETCLSALGRGFTSSL